MQPENKINYYLGNLPASHFVRITHGLWRLGLPKNQAVREPRKPPKGVIPAALDSRMAGQAGIHFVPAERQLGFPLDQLR